MTRLGTALLLWIVAAAPVSAQTWPAHAAVANQVSNWLVAGQVTAATVDAWRHEDKRAALGCLGLRLGITIGAAETVKALVHRTRPDGSDRQSFYSEHTAIATVASGWRVFVGVPLAIGTGTLRISAHKHFATDVLVGAMAGFFTQRVCS